MSPIPSRRGSPALAVALLLGLAACQTSPPVVAPGPAAPGTPVEPGVPAGAKVYSVVPADSLLTILVYRGGVMARMGHNHVVASHALSGTVYVTDDPLATRFEITLPVNELVIDEPELRAQEGTDFPPNVPQSARDGTRKNLLSPALLDGATYPEIHLRATQVIAAGQGYDVSVEITVKDQVRTVHVPVTFAHAGDSITATGEFPLTQSELGLKPFSILGGALQVLDGMRVKFAVVAKMGTFPIS